MIKIDYPKREYVNVFPNYLESSLKKQQPFYHTNPQNNLEVLIKKEEPKEKGLLEKVFSDKGKTLKETVKALLNEIELRENLDSHLLNNIDNDICGQNNYNNFLKNIKVQYSLELAKDVGKAKAQVESNILELEKQKRTEYLECWRDLMFLKKYLLSALKDYWDVVKKREMLSGDFSALVEGK